MSAPFPAKVVVVFRAKVSPFLCPNRTVNGLLRTLDHRSMPVTVMSDLSKIFREAWMLPEDKQLLFKV
jgi:hypothetical protein